MAMNLRKKARSSASGFASSRRLSAGACRDAEPIVAMTRALVFQNAFFGAENEFSPDSLKDSFNCLDLGRHGVYPVFIRGERMENGFPWLPFGGGAATSAAANFHKSSGFKGSRWLASSSISCRV
jgi:hypothetical protein